MLRLRLILLALEARVKPGPYNQHARVCRNGCRIKPGESFCGKGFKLLQTQIRSEEARRRHHNIPTMEQVAADVVAAAAGTRGEYKTSE